MEIREQNTVITGLLTLQNATRKASAYKPLSDKQLSLTRSVRIPEFTEAEENLADHIINTMCFAGKEGHRVAAAVVAKLNYNHILSQPLPPKSNLTS